MILAEIEIRHSRRIAPTRRVALGDVWLPSDPAPGFGGILLAAVVARYCQELPEEHREELVLLSRQLRDGEEIVQPRLRHRFQVDTTGLDSSYFALIGDGSTMGWHREARATPAQLVLAALYAARGFPLDARHEVFRLLEGAMVYRGHDEEEILRMVSSESFSMAEIISVSDSAWALEIFGFGPEQTPTRSEVLARFRILVRDAHPDSKGAQSDRANILVNELQKAKKILLRSMDF